MHKFLITYTDSSLGHTYQLSLPIAERVAKAEALSLGKTVKGVAEYAMKTYEEIEAILAPWTSEHMEAAQREGWDLNTATDSTSDVQVQRIDDPEELPSGISAHLPSDAAAMKIVRDGTGPHHVVARKILQEHFPEEWALIQKV